MSVGPGCISRIELFTWFVQQGMEESAWLCDPITIVHFVILNGLSGILECGYHGSTRTVRYLCIIIK